MSDAGMLIYVLALGFIGGGLIGFGLGVVIVKRAKE